MKAKIKRIEEEKMTLELYVADVIDNHKMKMNAMRLKMDPMRLKLRKKKKKKQKIFSSLSFSKCRSNLGSYAI